MTRQQLRDFVLPVLFLVLATAIIATSGADLKVSAPFCIAGKWPVGDREPWHFLYVLDRFPAFALAGWGLAAAIAGAVSRQRRRWLKPGLFLVVLLALGPGLTVNALFKEYWGRPRPREVQQFGGTKQFLHPWQPGSAHKGRSFPSGHSSAAFYLSAPFFILRRNNRRAAFCWLAGGVVFGTLMSVARISQGAHFLSDTLWAWGMVHLIAVALYHLMRPDLENTPVPAP